MGPSRESSLLNPRGPGLMRDGPDAFRFFPMVNILIQCDSCEILWRACSDYFLVPRTLFFDVGISLGSLPTSTRFVQVSSVYRGAPSSKGNIPVRCPYQHVASMRFTPLRLMSMLLLDGKSPAKSAGRTTDRFDTCRTSDFSACGSYHGALQQRK